MAKSFYDAVRDKKYRKESGEQDRQKRDDEEDQRIADRRSRETMGDDCPSPYRSRP